MLGWACWQKVGSCMQPCTAELPMLICIVKQAAASCCGSWTFTYAGTGSRAVVDLLLPFTCASNKNC
jgi:hypothetical protein